MKALLGLLLFWAANSAFASPDRGAQFQNLEDMIEALNLRPYFQAQPERRLKVAILDNGFVGAAEEIGHALPANTILHRASGEASPETHGFYMARIFWSLLSFDGRDTRFAPAELHLYPTFGYTNFKNAVDDAIARDVDIILYSQTWEYGGNFDGGGFINALVNRALDAGILWVNNAGNFGDSTFNSPIDTVADDWVSLPGPNHSVAIRCEQNPLGKCPVRAVLSWNAFSDIVDVGTNKDLDFVLTDDTLNVLASSSLAQTRETNGLPNQSLYPREILQAELSPGLYYLRVKNRSKNFSSSDRLRIVLSGEFLKMDGFDREESLLPPADNARVITVGAADSEKSSLSRVLQKPEIYTNSLVSLSADQNFKGNSNSAAMVAAAAAILLSLDPSLSRAEILAIAGQNVGAASGAGRGLPLESLGFRPTANCFVHANKNNLPAHLAYALSYQGTLVETSAGQKIFYNEDPIRLLPGISRYQANDILVFGPSGPGIYPRQSLYTLPPEYIELLQTPAGQQICASQEVPKLPNWARLLRLPSR